VGCRKERIPNDAPTILGGVFAPMMGGVAPPPETLQESAKANIWKGDNLSDRRLMFVIRCKAKDLQEEIRKAWLKANLN